MEVKEILEIIEMLETCISHECYCDNCDRADGTTEQDVFRLGTKCPLRMENLQKTKEALKYLMTTLVSAKTDGYKEASEIFLEVLQEYKDGQDNAFEEITDTINYCAEKKGIKINLKNNFKNKN